MLAEISDAIQHMVADEGSSGIGYRCRNSCIIDVLDHCFDRQSGEVSSRAVCVYRLIDRLIAFIIRNAAVVDVDADALYGDIRTSAGLADGDDHIRIAFSDLGINSIEGLVDDSRNLKLDNFRSGNRIRKQLDGFNGRVYFFPAERIKTSN